MRNPADRGIALLFFVTSLFTIFQGAAINLTAFPIYVAVISSSVFLFGFFFLKSNTALRLKLPAAEYQLQKFLFPFVIYAICSSFFLPLFFQGIQVYVPRNGITIAPNGPLLPNLSNIGQAVYILFNFILFTFIIRIRLKNFDVLALKLFQSLGFIALFFSFYQYFADKYNVYYPSNILNSSLFGYQGYNQTTDFGESRISGIFSEPSLNGNFLGMYFVYYLFKLTWRFSIFDAAAAFLFLLCTAITTSSLGYIEIFSGFILLLLFQAGKVLWSKRINKWVYILIPSLMALLYISATVFQTEITSEILQKNNSVSFFERSGSDLYSYALLLQTYGLGVGLGGNRPSSFLAYLVSNVGIPGTALFIAFLFQVVRPSIMGFPALRTNQKALLFAYFTFMIGKSAGVPDLSYQFFWIITAIVAIQGMQLPGSNLGRLKPTQAGSRKLKRISPAG